MITPQQMYDSLCLVRAVRSQLGLDHEVRRPVLLLYHFPDGSTEWRDDLGATGLFREGVGLRAYP